MARGPRHERTDRFLKCRETPTDQLLALCAAAQIANGPGEYLGGMKTIPTTPPSGYPVDFTLAIHVSPGDTYEWSKVLLARAHFNGTLELLTAAWERVLGYGRREFVGKTLRQFLRSGKPAATVAAILDRRNMEPVELTLRCRDGKPKRLRLHRRFDPYEHKMFIVAEEIPAARNADSRVPIRLNVR